MTVRIIHSGRLAESMKGFDDLQALTSFFSFSPPAPSATSLRMSSRIFFRSMHQRLADRLGADFTAVKLSFPVFVLGLVGRPRSGAGAPSAKSGRVR
ncbi:MAG: hypothetical protein H6924_01345 [Alphaproteobacteria bacterium]|nr:hypothetical protein [Alphaproteobacteria bacterium]